MTIQKISSTLFIAIILVAGIGCKKWRDNRETLTSEDHTLAEASFNDIIRNILIATSPTGQLLADSCFTISESGNSFPQTITIDFGNAGCEGLFGQQMQGKIIIALSDSMNHYAATATITTENFYSNKYKVTGITTVTNSGINSTGNQEYEMNVQNGVITAEANKTGEDFTVSWTCLYHYELIEKNNEQLLLDDLYRITGAASGVNEEGRSFTAEISEPLQKYINCRWVGSGKTKISPKDLKERDLSYGECDLNSTCCDNVATEIARWSDKAVRMK